MFMKWYYWLLVISLLWLSAKGVAQEFSVKRDSLRFEIPGRAKTDSTLSKSKPLPSRLMPLNPMENLQPKFTPYHRFTLSTQYSKESKFPPIYWDGASSDFILSKSRTAIASMMPTPRLQLYSSATLGLVETPYFGKANYYIVSGGANYALSSDLSVGMSGGYNSNFGSLPYWKSGISADYRVSPNLSVDGGLTYLKSAANPFNVNQSALLLDLHGRYRLTDDWYLNAYGGMPVRQRNEMPGASIMRMMPIMNSPYFGGTVEHWFNPTMGVEAGMIWMRDMFSGKMRPRPKLELLFKPGN